MGKLKVLPAEVANLIAAGEVVGRPASVVKELVENAVDAGATRIDVLLTDSGRTLIQVMDNGCGMSATDALLCFERHATSKIAEPADLERIDTYGFRGEALASIAAVSEITLKTRRTGDATGTKVNISGMETKSSEVACPEGTNFEIRNLFYNVPARRKFLKSDSVELRHCVDEFIRVALTRPELSLSIRNNGRDIYVLKPAISPKVRIQDLLGPSVARELLDVEADTSLMKIKGYCCGPKDSHKTAGNQYFFVNGRYFRSPLLHKAVLSAYRDLIPEGYSPSYFLFLETDPSAFDVNIHPQKTEVKFEDDSIVFQIISACIKQTLGRNSFREDIDFESGALTDIPSTGRSFEAFRGDLHAPEHKADETYNPFRFSPNPGFNIEPLLEGTRLGESGSSAGFSAPQRNARVIGGKYVICDVDGGILAVNVNRAFERITYENALASLDGKNVCSSEKLLFPRQVIAGAAQIPVFEEKRETLLSLGYDIAPFGADTVVINALPAGIDPDSPEELVSDLYNILCKDGSAILAQTYQSTLASGLAATGASHSRLPATSAEAESLLNRLFSCNNPERTPSGKPISHILGTDDIDKLF